MKFFLAVFVLSILISFSSKSQTAELPAQKEIDQTMEGWVGLYTKYRLSERLFYYGEYHYRRRNYLKDMAQIYLRFGATYLINNHLEVTAGIVTPIYWAPDQSQPNIDRIVPQYRLWQQVLFVQPFNRAKIYHQIRTEQRWKRDYKENSEFKLTYRFRYKIMTYVPLNNHKLINNTLFLSAYDEIFIQAGKPIVYDHLEDNRLFVGLGYIINENLQVQAGYMWTFRHAGAPYKYEHRHIPRISLYHNFDFYNKRKLKSERELNRILENEF